MFVGVLGGVCKTFLLQMFSKIHSDHEGIINIVIVLALWVDIK